jgi:hypothetical protein
MGFFLELFAGFFAFAIYSPHSGLKIQRRKWADLTRSAGSLTRLGLQTRPAVALTSGTAGLKTDSMLSSSQYRAIVQLFAMTLHSFLLGIVVLASVPQVSDRAGDYRPVRESRLAALHDPVDGTALNRGVKRYDNQNPAGFLALARFLQAQVHQAARVSFYINDGSYRQPRLGVLPIRSPPFHLPL